MVGIAEGIKGRAQGRMLAAQERDADEQQFGDLTGLYKQVEVAKDGQVQDHPEAHLPPPQPESARERRESVRINDEFDWNGLLSASGGDASEPLYNRANYAYGYKEPEKDETAAPPPMPKPPEMGGRPAYFPGGALGRMSVSRAGKNSVITGWDRGRLVRLSPEKMFPPR